QKGGRESPILDQASDASPLLLTLSKKSRINRSSRSLYFASTPASASPFDRYLARILRVPAATGRMMELRRSLGFDSRRTYPAFSNRSRTTVIPPVVRRAHLASSPGVADPLISSRFKHCRSVAFRRRSSATFRLKRIAPAMNWRTPLVRDSSSCERVGLDIALEYSIFYKYLTK